MHELIDINDLKGVGTREPAALISAFCKSVSDLLATLPLEEVPGRIAEQLPSLLSCPDLLTPEQRSLNGEDYEKHEVFLCPHDDFSVLAVVWPAGIHSPIHDHQTWCTFGVLAGEIQETIYEAVDATLDCREARALRSTHHIAGSVAHMPVNASNIHCMHNPGTTPAISIHIYGGNSAKLGANVDKIYTVRA
jgi:predicted metal-dependent enzyme (double-stranded beta helix superfamily)